MRQKRDHLITVLQIVHLAVWLQTGYSSSKTWLKCPSLPDSPLSPDKWLSPPDTIQSSDIQIISIQSSDIQIILMSYPVLDTRQQIATGHQTLFNYWTSNIHRAFTRPDIHQIPDIHRTKYWTFTGHWTVTGHQTLAGQMKITEQMSIITGQVKLKKFVHQA